MEENNIEKVIVRLGFEQPNGQPLTYEYTYPEFKKGVQIKQPDGVQLVFVSRYSDFRKFDIIVQILEAASNKAVGNVIAVVFVFKDNSKEFIESVVRSSNRAVNTMMMIGDRTEGKTYRQIVSQESWRGMPAIGNVSDYVTVTMAPLSIDEPIPLPPDPPDPPEKPSEVKPEVPKPPIVIEPEQIPESPTFRPPPPLEGKNAYLHKVRRNARYRGPRESDKEFLNHEEARFDLMQMMIATEEITELTEKLINNIEGNMTEKEFISQSPIIDEIHKAIESVEILGEDVLAIEVKRLLNEIKDMEKRTDYYGRTIHAKS